MSRFTVAALQLGALPEGRDATLERILGFEDEIASTGARLVVMPEALLGGYPKGEIFGTRLGYRLPEGRELFRAYFENAVDVPGRETDALCALSSRLGCVLVIGVIERAGSSLYCTALTIDPQQGLAGTHRKIMPTGTERLIWAQGDGSTIGVQQTAAGRVGTAICWENHMPLLRTAMYAKGLDIWCAPTVDERDIWRSSMRHIAHEGRCFVVSPCQVLPSPRELGKTIDGWDPDRPLIGGGSMIVGPLGDVLAGPLLNSTGLLHTEIDLRDIVSARYDFDVVGHYARPDIFKLTVNETSRSSVAFCTDSPVDRDYDV